MSTQLAVLQMHQREDFERNVIRSLGAGALAGALAYLTVRIGDRVGLPGVPLSFLTLSGAALACVRGDKLDKWMLSALSLGLTALPWTFGLSHGWTVALSGAACGAIMVKGKALDQRPEHSVGALRPGLAHYFAGAAATAGLAVAGLEVARVIGLRLTDFQAPAFVLALMGGVVMALFASIGGIAAHLMLKSDPVEVHCEELISTLDGEFETLAQRALNLYRQCGVSLQQLPPQPAREELAKTLQKLTTDTVELASEWVGVENQLQDDTLQNLLREIEDLNASAAKAKDVVARRQLEMAATSLKEEVERLGELQQKRERVLAKLKSQTALLERAKVALIGMRSSQTQIKAAEMSALSRKFKTLATLQADEAKLAHEVATTAELASQESDASEPMASPPVVAPVTSVDAPGANSSTQAMAEVEKKTRA